MKKYLASCENLSEAKVISNDDPWKIHASFHDDAVLFFHALCDDDNDHRAHASCDDHDDPHRNVLCHGVLKII